MPLIAFILASTLLTSASESSETASAEKAKTFYLQIFKDSADYRTAVEELMKIFYEDQDWPRFFAYARAYRLRFDSSERSETELLEALALLRHCQAAPLKDLIAQLREEKKESSSTLDRIESLAETRFRGKSASEAKLIESPLLAHFKGKAFRKLKSDQTSKFDPAKMRVKVENLCEF